MGMDEREAVVALERNDESLSDIMAAVCVVAVEAARLDNVRLVFKKLPIFSTSIPCAETVTPNKKTRNKVNVLDRMLAVAIILDGVNAPKGAMSIRCAVQKIQAGGYRTHDNFSKDTDDPKKLVNNRAMGNIVLLNLRANS